MITAVRTVYYADKSALLRDLMVPLARELGSADGVESAWLQSRWRRGPHIVLFVSGTDVEPAVVRATARIEAYLAAHPSTTAIDPQEYEQTSLQLGRLELLEGPYLPLLPDNTVERGDDTVVDTFVRSATAAAVKGRIMSAGLTAVDEVILRTRASAVDTVYAGMSAIATAYPQWGLVSGYQAFLSHWKEYFFWADPDGTLESALAASYAEQSGLLLARLESAHTESVVARAADPVLDAWSTWVETALPLAMSLADAGEVLPYPHPARLTQAAKFGPETKVQWSGSDERQYSDFHRAFRELDFTRLGNGTDFAAYRFVINCFFELLPMLGVAPIQRYAVAYLFTTASQEVVGETWQETIARAVDRQRETAEIVPTLPWRGGQDD